MIKTADNKIERRGEAHAYVYAVGWHEDERELCALEMTELLGSEPREGCVTSCRSIDPWRSPFIRAKLTVAAQSRSLEGLDAFAAGLELEGRTFKVVFMDTDGTVDYDRRRECERQVGWSIRGKAEMRAPGLLFGLARVGGMWLFGMYEKGEAVWLKHSSKPRPYSTALSSRVARAVVNIAAPAGSGVRLIDPCCGTGTVLIEALSMGMDCAGYDINPLAVRGARVNLAHFGLPDVAKQADMCGLPGGYDAAIVDLPYNLCSIMPEDRRLDMLRSAARLAERIVIVTTEDIDDALERAGLEIVARCAARKGRFERQIIVCRQRPQPGQRPQRSESAKPDFKL